MSTNAERIALELGRADDPATLQAEVYQMRMRLKAQLEEMRSEQNDRLDRIIKLLERNDEGDRWTLAQLGQTDGAGLHEIKYRVANGSTLLVTRVVALSPGGGVFSIFNARSDEDQLKVRAEAFPFLHSEDDGFRIPGGSDMVIRWTGAGATQNVAVNLEGYLKT